MVIVTEMAVPWVEERDMDLWRPPSCHRVTPERQSLIPIVTALAVLAATSQSCYARRVWKHNRADDGGYQKRAAYMHACGTIECGRSVKVELLPASARSI